MKSIFKNFFSKKCDTDHNSNSDQKQIPTSIKELQNEIDDLGHAEYPFLSNNYSPNSRVPATDFIPFIKYRIINNDYQSIIQLMRNILASNAGVGARPEWIDDEIDEVKNSNVESYVDFDDKDVYAELSSLFIIASKSGGDRPFWLTKDIPKHFSWILGPYFPKWKNIMHDLADKANEFIDEKGKDLPYWEDYPKLKVNFGIEPLTLNKTVEKVRSLSPAARLQLFFAVSHEGGSLPTLANYPIRSMGINVNETSEEIINSKLLVQSYDPQMMLRESKRSLLEICEDQQIDYRKSWSKGKLVNALGKERSEFVKVHLENNDVVTINTDYKSDLLALFEYVENLTDSFKALCFIQ